MSNNRVTNTQWVLQYTHWGNRVGTGRGTQGENWNEYSEQETLLWQHRANLRSMVKMNSWMDNEQRKGEQVSVVHYVTTTTTLNIVARLPFSVTSHSWFKKWIVSECALRGKYLT